MRKELSEAVALARQQLAKRFPETQFLVRANSRRDCVTVAWSPGPAEREVSRAIRIDETVALHPQAEQMQFHFTEAP